MELPVPLKRGVDDPTNLSGDLRWDDLGHREAS
jgi:hypothetical protein